ACGRTTPKLSGKVDLDGRWCCGVCWEANDQLPWLPKAAQDHLAVTDCLTIQGSQLAVAMLVGRKIVECRQSEFDIPDGWYALHVAKEAINPQESHTVKREWPSVPQEEELPHDAIVGLVHLRRTDHRESLPSEASPWLRPGTCFVVLSAVALSQTLPSRAPGRPAEPWRLSPAAQRRVRDLAAGMPVYKNRILENSDAISCGKVVAEQTKVAITAPVSSYSWSDCSWTA
ncbi:unnamed protein product, partial [Polarella glacialis]